MVKLSIFGYLDQEIARQLRNSFRNAMRSAHNSNPRVITTDKYAATIATQPEDATKRIIPSKYLKRKLVSNNQTFCLIKASSNTFYSLF